METDLLYEKKKRLVAQNEFDMLVFLENVKPSGTKEKKKNVQFGADNTTYPIYTNPNFDKIDESDIKLFSFKTPLGFRQIKPDHKLSSFQDAVSVTEISLKDPSGFLKKLIIFGENHFESKLCSGRFKDSNWSDWKYYFTENETLVNQKSNQIFNLNLWAENVDLNKAPKKNPDVTTFSQFFNHLNLDSDLPIDFWLENSTLDIWEIASTKKSKTQQALADVNRREHSSTSNYSTKLFSTIRKTGRYQEFHRFHFVDFRLAIIEFGHHNYGINEKSINPETGKIDTSLEMITSNFVNYLHNIFPQNLGSYNALFKKFASLLIAYANEYKNMDLETELDLDQFNSYFKSEIWFEFFDMLYAIEFDKKSQFRWLKSVKTLIKQDPKKVKVIFLFFGLQFIIQYQTFIKTFLKPGILGERWNSNPFAAYVHGGFFECHFLFRFFRKWSKLKPEHLDFAQFSIMFTGEFHNFAIFNFFQNMFSKFFPEEFTSSKKTHFSELCKEHFLTDELLIPDGSNTGYIFL